jgi:amino acid transporter
VGNTTAFFAILSLNTLALYISYILPITFFLLTRIRNSNSIPYGPFRLGPFGIPANIFAIVYGVFIIIFLPFPPLKPVTGANLNYAGPVMGAVIVFAVLDWGISGRKRFRVVDGQREAEVMDREEANG